MDTLQGLPFYSTDELLEELLSRHDHAAFVGAIETTVEGDVRILRRYKGNRLYVVGLCADISALVMGQWRDENKPVEDE